MNQNIYLKKKLTSEWFHQLQQVICHEFEKIETNFGKKTRQRPKYFKRKNWKKSPNNGGGTYAIIKDGLLFDRVGVNFSEVSGKFNKKFKSQVLGTTKNIIATQPRKIPTIRSTDAFSIPRGIAIE